MPARYIDEASAKMMITIGCINVSLNLLPPDGNPGLRVEKLSCRETPISGTHVPYASVAVAKMPTVESL